VVVAAVVVVVIVVTVLVVVVLVRSGVMGFLGFASFRSRPALQSNLLRSYWLSYRVLHVCPARRQRWPPAITAATDPALQLGDIASTAWAAHSDPTGKPPTAAATTATTPILRPRLVARH
jgi:hypothetical protein